MPTAATFINKRRATSTDPHTCAENSLFISFFDFKHNIVVISKQIDGMMKIDDGKEIISELLVSKIDAILPKANGAEKRTAKDIPIDKKKEMNNVNNKLNRFDGIFPINARTEKTRAMLTTAKNRLIL